MVTKQQGFDFLSSPEFRETRDFLADFGLSPRPVEEYLYDDVKRAISTKPWELEIEEEIDPPGWKASIREWRTVSQSRTAVARDPDRVVAVLRAIRMALGWPTPEEERRAFEEQTQSLLSISADEFMRRWQARELSADDPRVGHLLIVRPLGW